MSQTAISRGTALNKQSSCRFFSLPIGNQQSINTKDILNPFARHLTNYVIVYIQMRNERTEREVSN